jgi:Transglutaminase-like superfamily
VLVATHQLAVGVDVSLLGPLDELDLVRGAPSPGPARGASPVVHRRRFRGSGASTIGGCGLPGDPHGLVASLALIAVLAPRGIAASLVIGMRPDKGLGAHARVEVGGMPALPAAKDKFAQLVAL